MSYVRTPEYKEKMRRIKTGGLSYEENFRKWVLPPDSETGCMIWAGSLMLTSAYGQAAKSPNGERYAHRVAWELSFGAVPSDKCVLHRCDVQPCVTPAHLFLGTQADNVADMMNKGRGNYGDITGIRRSVETRAKMRASWTPERRAKKGAEMRELRRHRFWSSKKV